MAISASAADQAHFTEADRIVVKTVPFYYFPEAYALPSTIGWQPHDRNRRNV